MKTLRINPFHLRPQIKNIFRKPKHVEIPYYIYTDGNEKMYDKLIGLQNNLDYIATKFGIDFLWDPGSQKPIVHCYTKKGFGQSEKLSEDDSTTDISHKMYTAASNALIEDNKKPNKKTLDVRIEPYNVELANRFEEYRGILDFYTNKYGMTFRVDAFLPGHVVIHGTKDIDTVSELISLKKDDEEHKSIQYKKIHNLVKQLLELYNERPKD